MKLATFLARGHHEPLAGTVLDDTAVAFTDGRQVVDVLAGRGSAAADGEAWPLAEVTLLAPVPEPGTMILTAAGLAAAASHRHTPLS